MERIYPRARLTLNRVAKVSLPAARSFTRARRPRSGRSRAANFYAYGHGHAYGVVSGAWLGLAHSGQHDRHQALDGGCGL